MAKSRRLVALTAVASAALVVGLAGCGSTGAGPRAAAPAGSVACRTVRGPFRVSGTSVLAADGSPFIAYGMTVGGLQQPDYAARVSGDLARITATARGWCANTVRLQLRQANLVGVTPAQAAAFLDALGREVTLAEQNHLVVVLNDQTESDPGGMDKSGAENGPTPDTLAFWRPLIDRYGRDPQVVLDVFNEPRAQINHGGSSCGVDTWRIWQRGGTVAGHPFLGMQQLVDGVRADGATNLLWVQGPCWASTLSAVASYPITGGPLAYDFHHPGGAAPHTTAEWDADFGYLVDRRIAAVVDGEWTNRSSGDSSNCWSDAPAAVPSFLSYLAAHHIGMVAFQLVQGFMIASANNLTGPTQITATGPNRWHCDDAALDQGAGALVMAWFRENNKLV